jgi:hypothetical protein
MKRIFANIFAVVVLFILGGSIYTYGQGVTTAAINGTIYDNDGGPLPGAVVVVTHQPTGTTFGSTSRNDGRYNVTNLKVGGPYRIIVSFIGFSKQELNNIFLKLGENQVYNFTLKKEAIEVKEVKVTGTRTAVISSDKTGASTNVSNDVITEFPSITHSLQDFVKFSPLFSGSSVQGSSFSAQGRNNRYNNIQVDGTQYNDRFGLGSTGAPGGQANINPIGLDAIQEFQVVVAPYDVRLGGFTGGGINAITKYGTNDFKVGGYYYGRNQNFTGLSPDLLRSKLATFTEYQAGVSVGGPIVPDQLFFFVTGELTKRTESVSNIALSQNSPAINHTYDSVATLFRNILTNKFGYDPGDYNAVNKQRPSGKLFARLDWNISENHKLTLRNNYVDGSDEIITPGISNLYFPDYAYKFQTTTNSTVLQLSSTFSNIMSNELILGYLRIRDRRNGENSRPFPSVVVTDQGLTMYAGGEEFSQANELDQDIFELTDNFSYFLGNHVLTVGTHNELYKARNLFTRDYYGAYTFSSLANLNASTPVVKQYDFSYANPSYNDPRWAAKFNAITLGFYIQDEWTVIPNLKLTLGIRIDDPILPDKPTKNDTLTKYFGHYGVSTDKVPTGNILWSPRLGVNWDVEGDKITQVRGGVGVFTGSMPYVWLSNDYSNTGLQIFRIRSTAAGTPFVIDPFNQPKPGDPRLPGPVTPFTSEIDASDPNLKLPQVLRFDAAVDRQLPFGMVGTLEFLYSKAVNDLYYVDYSVGAQTTTAFDGRPVYSTVYKNIFTDVLVTKNESKSYSFNFVAQLQGSPLQGFYTNLGYTFGTAKDLNSVASSQALSQWQYNPISGNPNDPPLTTSNYELKHRIFAGISYSADLIATDYTTTVSLFYNGQSGRPFSYTYNNSGADINNDGTKNDDLIYIPLDHDPKIDLLNPAGTAPGNWDAVNAFINADDYLKSHRGQIAVRNGSREPWLNNLDFKLTQKVAVYGRNSLELSLDILNVINLIDRASGYVQTVTNQNNTSFTYRGMAANKAQISFSNVTTPFNNDNILSRWQMQLGARYSF